MSTDALSNQTLAGDDEPEPGSKRAITVSLDVSTDTGPDAGWLRDRLVELAARLELPDPSLSVVIVDDDTIARMHREFLDVEATTDVITFDLSDDDLPPLPEGEGRGEGSIENDAAPPRPTNIDGELYICLDEATRQAARYGHSVDHELLLYALHGLLHLVGYDDHDPADHQAMHHKEDELLTAIGLPPLYAPRREDGR